MKPVLEHFVKLTEELAEVDKILKNLKAASDKLNDLKNLKFK